MTDYKVQAEWMRLGTAITWTLRVGPELNDSERHNLSYAIRDGLRLHGYDAEVVISTEAAVE